MKKYIRAVAAVLAVFLTVPLFGCSVFNVFSVDSLIKSPRLTGDNAEIQKAFESAVGNEASLVRPIAGEYRSAYVLYDYDGDGVNEAIVFYMPKDMSGEVRMHFLKYSETEREWESVSDVKGNGSEVYSITFCNFDRDSVAEIAVAWAYADGQKDKMLTVYRYTDTEGGKKDFVGLASVRISGFNFIDVDFDGAEELLYTILDSASEKPAAQLKSLKFDIPTERFVPLSEVQLDSRIVSFVSYAHDMRAGNYRFYIDTQLSDGRYMTEIVYYDYSHSAFVRPSDENGAPLGQSTVRQTHVTAEDINDDGSVEVPQVRLYEKSEVLPSKEGGDNRIFETEYFNFDGKGLVSIGTFYICEELNVRINIEKYRKTAYIRFDTDSDSIMFYAYPEDGKDRENGAKGDTAENTESASSADSAGSAEKDGVLLFTLLPNAALTSSTYGSDGEPRRADISVNITQTGADMGITADAVLADITPIKTEK